MRIWVATRKGVFAIENKGGRWGIPSAHFLGDNATMLLPDGRDGAVYVALGHGHFGCKMHRSRDGGKSWQACAVPKYPPMPEGMPPELDMWNKPLDWSLEMIWELESGGADQPGTLWAGTVPGGLFRSDDGGDSWEINRPLWDEPARKKWMGGGVDHAGLHSISVDPRDPRRLTIAVSSGGVWHTDDAGATWEQRGKGLRAEYLPPELQYDLVNQDAHRLVRCPAQPDAMWIQHHNGIFASSDAGLSWREIGMAKPSNFGFAVVTHPREPGTAWFVPAIDDQQRIPAEARVVVSRTRDGGETFDVLSDGLPGQNAYDIVFRHCLDIDRSGEMLAFGSTTGSLWVSQNQGDSWQTVSEHLPPIHCVRFERR